MSGYESLANAIVQQAAEDYRSALKRIKMNPSNKDAMSDAMECERFFRSRWYTDLTHGAIDGKWLVRKLKLRELEKAEKACDTILANRDSTVIQATVTFPRVNGAEEQEPVQYVFPQRLANAIMDTLSGQLETIQAEIEKLKEGVSE